MKTAIFIGYWIALTLAVISAAFTFYVMLLAHWGELPWEGVKPYRTATFSLTVAYIAFALISMASIAWDRRTGAELRRKEAEEVRKRIIGGTKNK